MFVQSRKALQVPVVLPAVAGVSGPWWLGAEAVVLRCSRSLTALGYILWGPDAASLPARN